MSQQDRKKSPRKVADHAFLRIHFEIAKTMDLIDDMTETLSQVLAQRNLQRAAANPNKFYCTRCVRRRNARNEMIDRIKTLQVLASDDPPLGHAA